MAGVPIKPGPWRWEVNKAERLSPAAHHVALTIGVHFDKQGMVPDEFRFSMTTLAKEAHMRRETAIKAVRELRDAGYLGADMGKGRLASKYWSTVPVAVAQTVPQKHLAVTHSALAVAQTGVSGTARVTQSPSSPPNHHAEKFASEQEKEDFFDRVNAENLAALVEDGR